MKTRSGRILAEADVEALAVKAEHGVDLSRWGPRRGRPSLGEAGPGPSPRVGARVSEETYQGFLKRAMAEGRTTSEVVRSLVEAYASPSTLGLMTLTPNPTQAQRIAARKALIAMSRRRQRPGSGSILDELLKRRGTTMDWWGDISKTLAAGGVPTAVAGAIAANAYMPPRHTADFDLMVELSKLPTANEVMENDGWESIGELDLYEGLKGTAWKDPNDDSRQVDIMGLPSEWGRAAIAAAQDNAIGGIPTLTVPFLVITKLISSRTQDTADLSRVLGAVGEPAREEVRVVLRRYRPDDIEDVDQLIELGRLEFGS